MNIEETKISIRNLVDGYEASEDSGIIGYGGMLDIRPPYQREFIHENNVSFQTGLMESVYYQRPINLVYFADMGDGSYELLDGQQRIITISRFVLENLCMITLEDGKGYFWTNLSDQDREKILGYELNVYICTGTQKELMKWFQTINTGAQALSNQELRNSLYPGPWVTSAKFWFTKKGNQARMCSKYMSGNRERQDHLERIIQWKIGSAKDDAIRQFMAEHQMKPSAENLWNYFVSLDEWISHLFDHDQSMKSVDWGKLYTEYSRNEYDSIYVKSRQDALLKDDEVTDNKGVYEYILSGETKESLLNLRKFPNRIREKFHKKQDGKCAYCLKEIKLHQAHADHITPWSAGGKTEEDNCQILCRDCNLSKSNKQ